MALVRWQPINDFATLQSDMNRLFNNFFEPGRDTEGWTGSRWTPAMDLAEQDDHYVLTADLPGLSEPDISIEVEDRTLTISGERKSERESSGGNYHRLERATGSFSRSLVLPDGVDPEQIEAHFDKGVLRIEIPKPAQTKPHRIDIQVGKEQRQLEEQAS
ncbi:MAG TPA: Hsp20/alpha crystallin family protein [Baekduia sp.]|nr:Hsp20/alpha crystallin family protein [Baekduia sp.]